MAILIPKMDMPASCEQCPLNDEATCSIAPNYVSADPNTYLVADMYRRSDCKLVQLPPIEELMEPMCDQCQWPGWYKNPDDMQREKCSRCPVEAKLMEALYGET